VRYTSLFNGKDLKDWQEPHGIVVPIRELDAATESPRGPARRRRLLNTHAEGVNLLSKMPHGDCSCTFEFCVPRIPQRVYLMGRYECRFRSFGKKEIAEQNAARLQPLENGRFEGHNRRN